MISEFILQMRKLHFDEGCERRRILDVLVGGEHPVVLSVSAPKEVNIVDYILYILFFSPPFLPASSAFHITTNSGTGVFCFYNLSDYVFFSVYSTIYIFQFYFQLPLLPASSAFHITTKEWCRCIFLIIL